jgi:inhibitor of cysteine peptidase
MIRISSEDSGRKVHLTMHDSLEVSLEANPSTGYIWEVVSGQELLELVSEPEFSAGSRQVLGAGGGMRFEFRPISSGETQLEMAYHRSFEPGVEPVQKFSILVIVEVV